MTSSKRPPSISTSHFYGQFCKYGQIKKFIKKLIFPVNVGILDPFKRESIKFHRSAWKGE